MVDYADPQWSSARLSDREREDAVQRLSVARGEGRLTPEEFEARARSARAAVTRGELDPLFADLPVAAAPRYDAGQGAPASVAAPESRTPRVRPLGGPIGATIMALVPFIAVLLFFLAGYWGSFAWSWLWFLLVPLAGIIIYGPAAEYRSRDKR
ncbi:MAG: DUF1707 domain-containing protein [Leifsonia flava]